jgi:hypothetical protein
MITTMSRSKAERAPVKRFFTRYVTGEMTWILRERQRLERLVKDQSRPSVFYPVFGYWAICQLYGWRFCYCFLFFITLKIRHLIIAAIFVNGFYRLFPSEFTGSEPNVRMLTSVT